MRHSHSLVLMASSGRLSAWGGKFSQTTRAHRLLLKAWQSGGQVQQQRLLTLLFRAHFEQTEDIGNVEMLADRAEKSGLMSKEMVRLSFLCLFLAPRAHPPTFTSS